MSRDPLDLTRDDIDRGASAASAGSGRAVRDDARDPVAPFVERFDLQRTPQRAPVRGREQLHLRDSETRILARVGAFRVVPEHDLGDVARSPSLAEDLRHLEREGLVERRRLVLTGVPETVVSLTRAGKRVLDTHADRTSAERPQVYHAGLVKPRQLAHDAQLYRAFRAEAERTTGDGDASRASSSTTS